jgi:hypothetical protein
MVVTLSRRGAPDSANPSWRVSGWRTALSDARWSALATVGRDPRLRTWCGATGSDDGAELGVIEVVADPELHEVGLLTVPRGNEFSSRIQIAG